MDYDRGLSVNWLIGDLMGQWLNDADVTEVAVNRPGEVWCERQNVWERHENDACTLDQLQSLATSIAVFGGKDVSDTRPILSAILPTGERVQVVRSPACEEETVSITIRKPAREIMKLEQYVTQGFFEHIRPVSEGISTIDLELLDLLEKGDHYTFIRQAVRAGKNIVVSGETSSGKTSLMKSMMHEIPSHERIITIEDVSELFLPAHPNHVHLFYQAERAAATSAEVTPSDLLKSSLRMKPDRIMLAEVRGGETYDFLNVVASGHGGSITSCHAGSCELTFERLALMVLQSEQGRALPYDVIRRLLFLVVDVVIHLHNDTVGGLGRHMTGIHFDPVAQRDMAGV